jgi:hypothetical protein
MQTLSNSWTRVQNTTEAEDPFRHNVDMPRKNEQTDCTCNKRGRRNQVLANEFQLRSCPFLSTHYPYKWTRANKQYIKEPLLTATWRGYTFHTGPFSWSLYPAVIEISVKKIFDLIIHPHHTDTIKIYFFNDFLPTVALLHQYFNKLGKVNMEHQIDATITVLLIFKSSSTCFGQAFAHLQERRTEIFFYNIWYNVLLMW